MFSCLFVRLFCTDPNEFLKDVAHVYVVHSRGREVDGSEPLDDQIEKVFLSHSGDLRTKVEPLHNRSDIGRKAVDVAVQVRRELVGVVQQPR